MILDDHDNYALQNSFTLWPRSFTDSILASGQIKNITPQPPANTTPTTAVSRATKCSDGSAILSALCVSMLCASPSHPPPASGGQALEPSTRAPAPACPAHAPSRPQPQSLVVASACKQLLAAHACGWIARPRPQFRPHFFHACHFAWRGRHQVDQVFEGLAVAGTAQPLPPCASLSFCTQVFAPGKPLPPRPAARPLLSAGGCGRPVRGNGRCLSWQFASSPRTAMKRQPSACKRAPGRPCGLPHLHQMRCSPAVAPSHALRPADGAPPANARTAGRTWEAFWSAGRTSFPPRADYALRGAPLLSLTSLCPCC